MGGILADVGAQGQYLLSLPQTGVRLSLTKVLLCQDSMKSTAFLPTVHSGIPMIKIRHGGGYHA